MDENEPIFKIRETNNPYLSCGSGLVSRLIWDLNIESWKSRYRLKKLKNSHKGEKAVILCNGPSLLKVDFDLLHSSDVFCFGLNKVNLLFDKTGFRPNCVVAVNPFVIEQNREFFNTTDLPVFIDSDSKQHIKSRQNTVFLHSSTKVAKFARDCSISINQGATVTVVALQLAFHMGFSKVALVGADHNFAVKGVANKTVVSGEKDESHFDPNYFAGGVKWQLPDLFESEVWYGRARQVYNAFDREIFNATDGGKLECFERLSLEQFLE